MSRPRTRPDTIWRATGKPEEIERLAEIDREMAALEQARNVLAVERHGFINRICGRARMRRKKAASLSIVS